MKIAVAQTTSGIDPAENAEMLVRHINDAAAGGAVMLFTPEMSGMLDADRTRAAAKIVREDDDAVLTAICGAAAKAGIWVHLGSLAVLRDDGLYANRGYVIDETGAIRARYDKLHLFDVDLPGGERWRESAAYAAGDNACVVETPIGLLGPSICYDVRFAALYSALAQAGAVALSVPAAFTRPTGEAHWETLLRARAIENGAWVIAAAQTGTHQDGRQTWGHSMVIDPWGAVVLDMGEVPGLGFADIDPDMVADIRSRIASLRHARAIPPVERAP